MCLYLLHFVFFTIESPNNIPFVVRLEEGSLFCLKTVDGLFGKVPRTRLLQEEVGRFSLVLELKIPLVKERIEMSKW